MWLPEAIKLAMADRDAYYADPDFSGVPLGGLLSDAYTDLRVPLIDMQTASLEARPGDPYLMQPVVEGGVFRPGTGGDDDLCGGGPLGQCGRGDAECQCSPAHD